MIAGQVSDDQDDLVRPSEPVRSGEGRSEAIEHVPAQVAVGDRPAGPAEDAVMSTLEVCEDERALTRKLGAVDEDLDTVIDGQLDVRADVRERAETESRAVVPDAAVRCAADHRQALEQLCRYTIIPALDDERVRTNAAGHAVFKLKTAWRHGTTHLTARPHKRRPAVGTGKVQRPLLRQL